MFVPCRVPGCGRALRSVLGEVRHVAVVQGPQPRLSTVCIESDEVAEVNDIITACVESDEEAEGTLQEVRESSERDGSAVRVGGVGNVTGLDSDVFFELLRVATAPPPARPGQARRSVPSSQARRSRGGGHARRRRGARRHSRASSSTVAGSEAGDEEGPSTATASGAVPDVTDAPSGRGAPSRRGVCDDVFEYYERFGDVERATTAFPVPAGGTDGPERAAPWNKKGLWHVFVNACTASNGFGLSQQGLRRQYHYTRRVEAATGGERLPFTETFRTPNRFIAAVRRFKRAIIAPLDWQRASLKIGGRYYAVCFRDAVQAAQEELLQALPTELHWGPPEGSEDEMVGDTDGAQSTLLRGTWTGEMYQEQAAHVAATMRAGTRMLVLHLYSDATVLSDSGAVSAYPLRMRIVNVNTKKERWLTVAYIPQVEGKFLDKRKAQEVRSDLLQRVLHLTFRNTIQASHRGAWMDLRDGGRVRVSPRVLLYVCDQLEERAVMCLKASGCLYPCTPCMTSRENACSASGATAPARDVDATVAAQLQNATRGSFWGAQLRRGEVELAHSLNSVVPAMASWAGLGSGPCMLYRLPGFDRLHVRPTLLCVSILLSLWTLLPPRPCATTDATLDDFCDSRDRLTHCMPCLLHDAIPLIVLYTCR